MSSLRQEAKDYVAKKRKVVSDLDFFDLDNNIFSEDKSDNNGKPYVEKYIVINKDEYRVPESVISQIQELIKDNKNLKKVRVKATGSGMTTKYQVFPITE